ncbi:MAG TPA: IS481 family transposase, partial [Solirubrobacteraceae bacterium]
MAQHVRAALGPAGRIALVDLLDQGASFRQAAACLNVAPATAHKWWRRRECASPTELSRRSWALDRSSRPHRSPKRTSAIIEQRICQARQRTNLGPGRLAGLVDQPRSTVWAVLARHGLSRRRRAERQTFKRFEWSQPGALLHMDTKRLARFDVAGHRVTGQRSEEIRNRGAGYVFVHVVIDDHSRYLYVEQHDREDAETNTGTLERAIAHLTELGLSTPEAVMTDNALVYTRSARFQGLLSAIGAKHITPPPYTPRWNGKAERVIRTLQDEWAYAHRWKNSQQRTRALRSFVRYYNRRRPHSSLRDRPPISRVHN